MTFPNRSIITANIPLLLTIEEMTSPLGLITSIFHGFTLDDMRGLLDDVFESAICRPDDALGDFTREDLFFLKKETIRLAEAAFWLSRAKQDQITTNQ